MFADIIYNPNSCGQHFFKWVHTCNILKAEVVAFLKGMFRDVKSSTCLCAVLFSRKNKTVLNQALDISPKLSRIFLGKTIPSQYSHLFAFVLSKNATSELPSLLFFASKLFNLADWRYRFCIVPTFCFHNVSPEFYTGIPHTVDMWLVFLHWLSFRWPSKNTIAAMTIGQLTFHDMDMDATR